MYLIEFGFTRISVRSGFVFGNNTHPITTYRFGLVTVTVAKDRESKNLFVNALRGLSHDPDWLQQNMADIQARKENLYSEIKAGFKNEIDRLRTDVKKLSQEAQNARSENRTLRKAIALIEVDPDSPQAPPKAAN